ncbi:MAG: electron transfer flavoprotein subunit alpha/FixB family protein [Bacteroidia bacterium]|nr:electron transfer flavoprotein subunit alpha/FixB family protein [Bacteroidia bacterium]
MSILIYAESREGMFKKSVFELASYAAAVAKMMNSQAIALVTGNPGQEEMKKLGNYGISKILSFYDESVKVFDSAICCQVIEAVVKKENCPLVIFQHNNTGKALAPRLSARLKAGLVTAVISLPESTKPFIVTKKVYTAKAFARVAIKTQVKILTLSQNSYMLTESKTDPAIEQFSIQLDKSQLKISVKEVQLLTGKILLTDAEIVVSGGRGMRGPENWQPIIDLAEALGAATACSRPVSDEGWRPHTEHVGQTGKIIAPNLYIACGISGAIQHMGGVGSAKVVVAINKDKDAPIFEIADYGIVGDVFKVLPELISAVKEHKAK